ncbi:MAG: hypothetical protein ACHQ7N_04105 [Candidatus Methylomirabilales bacterium]
MQFTQQIVGTFEIAGVPCRVVSCHEGFWALLASRYADFAVSAVAELSLRVEVTVPSPDEVPARWAGPFARFGGQDGVLTIEGAGFHGTFDELSGEGWIVQPPDPAPLETFLTAICARRLLKKEGFLLHAAAINEDPGAYVFFGPSGSGKTTLAELVGKGVITDEMVAIRRDGGRYRVFAVPWRGKRLDASLAPPLAGLFRLRQGPETAFTPLSSTAAVRQLLPSVFFPRADASEVSRFFQIGGELVTQVPCYEMHFAPDGSFWDSIPRRRLEETHGLSL